MLPFNIRFDFFFFNDTATTEIYTLSLHDALPICSACSCTLEMNEGISAFLGRALSSSRCSRSEEHTSELQSPCNLVCRLLLEKKNISLQKHRHTNDQPLIQSLEHASYHAHLLDTR